MNNTLHPKEAFSQRILLGLIILFSSCKSNCEYTSTAERTVEMYDCTYDDGFRFAGFLYCDTMDIYSKRVYEPSGSLIEYYFFDLGGEETFSGSYNENEMLVFGDGSIYSCTQLGGVDSGTLDSMHVNDTISITLYVADVPGYDIYVKGISANGGLYDIDFEKPYPFAYEVELKGLRVGPVRYGFQIDALHQGDTVHTDQTSVVLRGYD
ncbi:MAG: hypothetical protein HWD92_13670 [Flavobacteriia bacterium]|nr:hypothetical protein [Flavobacteriia bacterium]